MAKHTNGEGSITKRKDGRFMGCITTSRDNTGKLIKKYVYGLTKQEVITKMDKIKHELLLGNYLEPDNITLETWLLYWLKTYKKTSLNKNL